MSLTFDTAVLPAIQRNPVRPLRHTSYAPPEPVRVVVVDDQPLVRTGLGCIVRAEPGFVVVGEGSAMQAAGLARDLAPHLMIVAARDEDATRRALRAVAQVAPSPALLLLVSAGSRWASARPQDLGVHGVVAFEEPASTLVDVMAAIGGGEPRGARSDATAARGGSHDDAGVAQLGLLTRRELEILTLIGEGLRNLEVAARLSISPLTVRNHVTAILDKLNMVDRFDLAVFAFRHGLVEYRPRRAAC